VIGVSPRVSGSEIGWQPVYPCVVNQPTALTDPTGLIAPLVIYLIIGGALIAVDIGSWWWHNKRGVKTLDEAQRNRIMTSVQKLRACGLGDIADAVRAAGTKPLPGNLTETVPGFAGYGKLTLYDPAFFADNEGADPLETTIHEALHVIACYKGIHDDTSPQHERVYEWAEKLRRQCERGDPCPGLPSNIKEVINDGAEPVYDQKPAK